MQKQPACTSRYLAIYYYTILYCIVKPCWLAALDQYLEIWWLFPIELTSITNIPSCWVRSGWILATWAEQLGSITSLDDHCMFLGLDATCPEVLQTRVYIKQRINFFFPSFFLTWIGFLAAWAALRPTRVTDIQIDRLTHTYLSKNALSLEYWRVLESTGEYWRVLESTGE